MSRLPTLRNLTAVGAVLFFAIFAWLGIYAWLWTDALSWPTLPARITLLQFESPSHSRGIIQFEYLSSDGSRHSSGRSSPSFRSADRSTPMLSEFEPEHASRLRTAFDSGTEVAVYVNPRNAQSALLPTRNVAQFARRLSIAAFGFGSLTVLCLVHAVWVRLVPKARPV